MRPFPRRPLATGLLGATVFLSPLLAMDAPESKDPSAKAAKALERVAILENPGREALWLRTETAGLRLLLGDTPEREARILDDPHLLLRPGDHGVLYATPEFLAAGGTFRILPASRRLEPSVAMGFRKVGDGPGFGRMGDIQIRFQNPGGGEAGGEPWLEDKVLEVGTWGVLRRGNNLVRIEEPGAGAGDQDPGDPGLGGVGAGDGKASAGAAAGAAGREERKAAGPGTASPAPAGAGAKARSVLDRQCAAVRRTVAAWREAHPEEPIRLVLGVQGWEHRRFAPGQWIFLDCFGQHFIHPLSGRGATDAAGRSTVPCLTADFNAVADLERIAEALRGALDVVCLDHNVCKWTAWGKEHLDAFRRMLRPGGCLQVPIAEWVSHDRQDRWPVPAALTAGAGAGAGPEHLLKGLLEQSFPKVTAACLRPDYLLKHAFFRESCCEHLVCEVAAEP